MTQAFLRAIAFCLLTLVLVVAFAAYGVPWGDSTRLNLAWFESADAVIRSGVLLPRHLPDLWGGLGGNDFFFYGQLPYFSAAIMHALCAGCGTKVAFAMAGGLGYALSGWAFYAFCRLFTGPAAAFFGGICYALMPYHLAIDWVSRQAAAEAFTYIFVPLVALGFERMRRGEGGMAAFALGIAGIGATHLPVGLLTVHMVAALLLAEAIRPQTTSVPLRRLCGGTIVAGLIGAGLSALFWLPALALLKDVSSSALYGAHYQASRWLIGASAPAPAPEFLGTLTVVGLATMSVAMLGLLSGNGPVHARIRWIVVLTIVPAFLMSVLSRPIWEYWIIDKVQFPWRLIVFIDLAAALGIATLVQRAGATAARLGAGAVATVAVLVATLLVTVSGDDRGRTRTGPPDMNIGAPEYLPPAIFAVVKERLEDSELLSLRVVEHVSELRREARERTNALSFTLQSRRAVAEVAPGQGELLLPLPYWRHWRGRDSTGAALSLTADPELGMTLVEAQDGTTIAGPVTLELPWHWSEWLAAALGAVSAVALLGLCSVSMGRSRQPAHEAL